EEPWIMPADIIQRVEEIQLKRLEQFGGFMPLNPQDEFDSNGNLAPDYKQKIQHLHSLARNGQITPAQYDAYPQDKITLQQHTHPTKVIILCNNHQPTRNTSYSWQQLSASANCSIR